MDWDAEAVRESALAACKALGHDDRDPARWEFAILGREGRWHHVAFIWRQFPGAPIYAPGGCAYVIDVENRLVRMVDSLLSSREAIHHCAGMMASAGRPWGCEVVIDWHDIRAVSNFRRTFDLDLRTIATMKRERRNVVFAGFPNDIAQLSSLLKTFGITSQMIVGCGEEVVRGAKILKPGAVSWRTPADLWREQSDSTMFENRISRTARSAPTPY